MNFCNRWKCFVPANCGQRIIKKISCGAAFKIDGINGRHPSLFVFLFNNSAILMNIIIAIQGNLLSEQGREYINLTQINVSNLITSIYVHEMCTVHNNIFYPVIFRSRCLSACATTKNEHESFFRSCITTMTLSLRSLKWPPVSTGWVSQVSVYADKCDVPGTVDYGQEPVFKWLKILFFMVLCRVGKYLLTRDGSVLKL